MLNNIIKSLIIILVLIFFVIVFKYYFSEKNIYLIKDNRNFFEKKLIENISNLPILPNDTNNVVEFNSGFEDSNKHNYKRSFWELFK